MGSAGNLPFRRYSARFQGCRVSKFLGQNAFVKARGRLETLIQWSASRPSSPGGDARLSTSDPETLKPCLFKMRRTPVDDVQGSCYYQTVPRVKSGLPVYGCPVGCATCAGDGLREDLG